MKALLSVAYFPSIQYFSKFYKYEVFIETKETFIKQTYRNRCKILTSNGVMNLIVPIKGSKHKIITEIEIDYSQNWQKQHLKAIENAYKSSAFFIHYIDEIRKIFQKKHKFLFDLDIEILETINKILDLNIKYRFTEKFIKPEQVEGFKDFRYKIKPKKAPTDTEFISKTYPQVFEYKFNFVENLSIIDLMFNLGPESKRYLKEVVR